MKMKLMLISLIVAVFLSVGLVGAQDAPVTLVRALANDIENFNTVTQSLASSAIAESYVFPQLYKTDIQTGLPVPGLTSWTISDDGLVYTFTIRPDANWSDGTPITSNDVKFTYDAIARPEVETIRKSFLESISALNVIDDKTFEIVLGAPNCNIWGDLSTMIMPAHKFAADFSDFTTSAFNSAPDISGGPYIVDEWSPDEFIRYEANTSYWDGVPAFDTLVLQVIPDPAVTLQALTTGDVDFTEVSPEDAEQLQGLDNIALYPLTLNQVRYLILNMGDPNSAASAYDENGNPVEQAANALFSDVRVRQAIAMGWDKDAAVAISGEGISRLVGTISPAITWAYNDEVAPYAYDPEAAAALLDEAGWTLNDAGVREKDGVQFAFNLDYISGRFNFDETAALIQDQLGQLGIQVNIQAMETGALVSEKAFPQAFDAMLMGITWDTPEPQILSNLILNSHQDIVGGGFNFPSYINPEVDDLLAQAGSSVDCSPEVRAPLYKQIQQIVHDDVAYDVISDGVVYTAFSTRIGNVVAGNWGFNLVQEWTVAE